MFTFEELSALFSAIWSTWVSALTGVVGLVLTVVALWWPNLPHRRIFSIVGIVILMISPMYAWRDEYRAHQAAKVSKTPVFSGAIPHISYFGSNKTLYAAVFVQIRNTGAPSIADRFSVTLKLKDGTVIQPEIVLPRTDIKLKNGSILRRDDVIHDKIFRTPIATGGQEVGLIFCRILGVDPKKGTEIFEQAGNETVVEFYDITILNILCELYQN